MISRANSCMNGMPIDSQATLAEVKAKQLAGELVDMADVEAKWRLACRLIRSRVLSVAAEDARFNSTTAIDSPPGIADGTKWPRRGPSLILPSRCSNKSEGQRLSPLSNGCLPPRLRRVGAHVRAPREN